MRELKSISRKQEKVLLALLAGQSVALAARNEKISESTIWRWLKLPAFQTRWRELRACAVELAISQIQCQAGVAVETLSRNLSSGHAPSEVRTAVSILRQSIEALDTFDLAERVARLEKQIEAGRR